MPTIAPHTLNRYLRAPLRPGEPEVSGELAVFPVFAGPPRLEYRAFSQAAGKGIIIQEMPGGATVNDLFVVNSGDRPVLLYEGEEVLGAQQNRTFDVSVLVAAGAKLPVPVSCVEQGRWDGSRHGEAFAPAPQAAYPELRREKSSQVRDALAAGGQARASQGVILRRRYGRRLARVTPTPAAEVYLYGDRPSAPQVIDGLNASLRDSD